MSLSAGKGKDGREAGQLACTPSLGPRERAYSEVGLRAAEHTAHRVKPPAQRRTLSKCSCPLAALPESLSTPLLQRECGFKFGEKPVQAPL